MDQLMEFPATAEVLAQLAEDVKAGYIDQLKQHGHYTTRGTDTRLIDSVETVVTVDGHSFTASLKLNDYWKYVEEDTKPHWPPLDAIRRWVEIKPVIPRPDGNGRIPTPQQLAFLIGRKMAGLSPSGAPGGTVGTHDLQKTKDAVIPVYMEKIQDALRLDIARYVKAVFLWE
jgi:hypothetical protein